MNDKRLEIILAAKDLTGKPFAAVSGRFKGLAKNATSLRGIMAGLAGIGGLRVIASMTSEWERLASMQERADAGLRQAMISMGRYSEARFEAIKKQADALQEVTTASNDAIEQGAKFLMTYKQISDKEMPEVIRVMVDLAALMKGDMVSAANMLGKASMGMTGELRRVGITVDQATYKSKGFAGVLRQISEQVAGQARALGETKQGGMTQLGNALDDVKKKLGEAVLEIKANMLPTLRAWVRGLDAVAESWRKLLGFNEEDMVMAHLTAQRDAMKKQLAVFQGVKAGSGFADKAMGWIPGYITQEQAETGIRLLNARISLVNRTIRRFKEEMAEEHTKRVAGGKKLPDIGGQAVTTPVVTGNAAMETTAAFYARMKRELFGFHDAALAVNQAQQQMDMEALRQKKELYGQMKLELYGLHDKALSLQQSQQQRELAGLKKMTAAHSKFYMDISTAMQGWANNWSATLNDMVWGAEISFKSISRSFARMITQMMIQKSIVEPLTSSLFQPLFKGIGGIFKGLFHRAAGGPVYADRPYVVGERGPELFIPGRTGAIAPSAGGVTVNIINNTPSRVEAREGYGASGGKRIDILIDEAVAQRIGAGGKTFQAIRRAFGINPPAFGR